MYNPRLAWLLYEKWRFTKTPQTRRQATFISKLLGPDGQEKTVDVLHCPGDHPGFSFPRMIRKTKHNLFMG